ncbi:hypothetical protein SUDANB105_00266 [Streptomyces sp. enrichment culture]
MVPGGGRAVALVEATMVVVVVVRAEAACGLVHDQRLTPSLPRGNGICLKALGIRIIHSGGVPVRQSSGEAESGAAWHAWD